MRKKQRYYFEMSVLKYLDLKSKVYPLGLCSGKVSIDKLVKNYFVQNYTNLTYTHYVI